MPPSFLFKFGFGGWLFYCAMLVFWIWMIIDCIENQRLSSKQMLYWFLVVAFLPCVGSLIYFFTARRR